eukprot:m.168270 g.168270  ORF g.168270 m.168270 type:complete len:60 (-) comp15315_c0_seq1:1037-1216(-)
MNKALIEIYTLSYLLTLFKLHAQLWKKFRMKDNDCQNIASCVGDFLYADWDITWSASPH